MCGCFGLLILVGSGFYLWDNLTHGTTGASTPFALAVVAFAVLALWAKQRERR